MRRTLVTYPSVLVGAILLAFTQTAAQSPNDIAPPPEFTLPIDCELGWNCWVVNYVDHDQSENVNDYRCGNQSYDGHKGTDFMIRNHREMVGGISVRAAASGTVVGTRDGMQDVDYRERKRELIKNKECGNGIRIDHGDGWITQYCHMRRNSVKVKKGDRVQTGDIIGFVGNSGFTIYPHLHFQVEYVDPNSGKRRGSIVDPMVGLARSDVCQAGENPLWSEFIMQKVSYQALSILDSGFAPSQPKHSALVKGLHDDETLSVRSPQLFLWARLLHVQKGDQVSFVINGPDGDEVLNYTSTIDKDQAYRSLHAGVRRPTLNWDEGSYRGFIKITRRDENGGRVFRDEAVVSLR